MTEVVAFSPLFIGVPGFKIGIEKCNEVFLESSYLIRGFFVKFIIPGRNSRYELQY